MQFGQWGPDGVPGTADDPVLWLGETFFLGGVSGYAGGTYNRAAGRYAGEAGGPLGADAQLRWEVFQININLYRYVYTLTNTGTGDMFLYFDSNGPAPPVFITVLNNFGDVELDGTAGLPWDTSVAPASETQMFWGGPPIQGWWGGGWNPETELEAEYYYPIPEPGTAWMLLAAGVALSLRLRRRRR